MIPRHELPRLALSVRQPWAWAIIHAGKDCENRGPMMLRHLPKPIERPIAIHAAKGLAKYEYESASEFMAKIGVVCPPPADLLRGGIIGAVTVTRVTKPSAPPLSRWFCGPRALMLENPQPCEFIPSVGALGYFAWEAADASIVPPPAKWMLPEPIDEARVTARGTSPQLDLIEMVRMSQQP